MKALEVSSIVSEKPPLRAALALVLSLSAAACSPNEDVGSNFGSSQEGNDTQSSDGFSYP